MARLEEGYVSRRLTPATASIPISSAVTITRVDQAMRLSISMSFDVWERSSDAVT